MRYVIYLDEQRIEEFEGTEMESLVRYSELLNDFKGEEVYDTIELFELKSVKKESLEAEKEDEKNG